MKDSKNRGAAGSKSARANQMFELAKQVRRNPKNRFAAEQLQLMMAGNSFARAEKIVQGRAEAAMEEQAKKNKPKKKK